MRLVLASAGTVVRGRSFAGAWGLIAALGLCVLLQRLERSWGVRPKRIGGNPDSVRLRAARFGGTRAEIAWLVWLFPSDLSFRTLQDLMLAGIITREATS
jgi:hypothetical protein